MKIGTFDISVSNYNTYKFLTQGNEELEFAFLVLLEKCDGVVGKAIERFRKSIKENRQINKEDVLRQLQGVSNITDCREVLEELFVQPISQEDAMMYDEIKDEMGWTIENIVNEYITRPNLKLSHIVTKRYQG